MCNATVDFLTEKQPFYPVTVNSEQLHRHFLNVAGEMLGFDNIKDELPTMGAEDFSFYSEVVPVAYFYFLGMQNESHPPLKIGHSPLFQVNEEVLPYGAALHAALAFEYLSDAQIPSMEKERVHDEL